MAGASDEQTLPLDLTGVEPEPEPAFELADGERVVRVLIDEPAIDRVFDYVVPAKWAERVRVGTIVRVDLRQRRVRGWVVEVDTDPPAGLTLAPVTKVSGFGPPPAVISVAEWAAERWVGRRSHFLRTASPPRNVERIGRRERAASAPAVTDALATQALDHGRCVVRVTPNTDPVPYALAAAARGRALILTPSADDAYFLAVSLRRAGVPTALMPNDWDRSAGGTVTVGTRAAALAPIGPLDAVLVFDEHDEGHKEEAAPTWNARDLAIERARRDGAYCALVSPTPTLEAIEAMDDVLEPSREVMRSGWPVVDVVDRRGDDPTTGEWCSPRLAHLLQQPGSVACVINRKGRARFPICHQCGEVPRSEAGQVLAMEGEELVDPASSARRPAVCANCGSTRFRRVRLGVTGVREELEAMARRPVAELTKDDDDPPSNVDLYVGTEAMLHRLDHVDHVVFLDFDQELLAPRFRAGEQALALLSRAARLVGPRAAGGRVVVQTRVPDHPVLSAARHADTARFTDHERELRAAMHLPPYRAMAVVSGATADAFVSGLDRSHVDVAGPDDGKWLVTAPAHDPLTAALRAAPRPPGRLRIEVDPLRA